MTAAQVAAQLAVQIGGVAGFFASANGARIVVVNPAGATFSLGTFRQRGRRHQRDQGGLRRSAGHRRAMTLRIDNNGARSGRRRRRRRWRRSSPP